MLQNLKTSHITFTDAGRGGWTSGLCLGWPAYVTIILGSIFSKYSGQRTADKKKDVYILFQLTTTELHRS